MGSSFHPYREDLVLPNAGLRIVKVFHVSDAPPRAKLTKYDCVYLCCNKPARLSHEQIKQRHNRKRKYCFSCRKQSAEVKARTKDEVQPKTKPMPTWPVPPSLLEKRNG